MWSTDEYAAGGYDPTLSVRLRSGFKLRLQTIANKRNTTVSALIEDWIADADGGARTDRKR